MCRFLVTLLIDSKTHISRIKSFMDIHEFFTIDNTIKFTIDNNDDGHSFTKVQQNISE